MEGAGDHVTSIARSRELATFVTRFVDEIKNTLCAPWEVNNPNAPCSAMKRTLTQVQNQHESKASSKVLNARMALGANNSIYLQSGMTMLWSGEMSSDMEYKMYPTSTQTGDLQHAGAMGMVTALHRQLETTRRAHANMTEQSDYVLAYILCINQVNSFVRQVVEWETTSNMHTPNIQWKNNMPMAERTNLIALIPEYEDKKPPMAVFRELQRLRKRGGGDFVRHMMAIVLSLLSDRSNPAAWWMPVATGSVLQPPINIVECIVDASSTFNDDTRTKLMEEASSRINMQQVVNCGSPYRYTSTFWPDDGDKNSKQANSITCYTGVQKLHRNLLDSKTTNQEQLAAQSSLLLKLQDMIKKRQVFGTERDIIDSSDNVETSQILALLSIKPTEVIQLGDAIEGWATANKQSNPEEMAYPSEQKERSKYIKAALMLQNTLSKPGPHQEQSDGRYAIKPFINEGTNANVSRAEIEKIMATVTPSSGMNDKEYALLQAEKGGAVWETGNSSMEIRKTAVRRQNKEQCVERVHWSPATLAAPLQVGTMSMTDTSFNICMSAVYESIAETDIQNARAKFFTEPGTQATNTEHPLKVAAVLAAAKLMQISPLSKVRNAVNTGPISDLGGWKPQAAEDLYLLSAFQSDDIIHVPFLPGLVHKDCIDLYQAVVSVGTKSDVVQMLNPRLEKQSVNFVPAKDRTVALNPENVVNAYPEFLTVHTIVNVLRHGLVAQKQEIETSADITKVIQIKEGIEKSSVPSTIRNVVQDSDERARRTAVWDDALRELSISGDRLYGFLRSMAGALHEDVTEILKLEDKSMEVSQRNLREQRKELTTTVTAFGQRLIDSLLTNIFKQSKLKVDLSNDGAADTLTGALVVMSDENLDQIKELASGQSGLPFFQQRVDLDRMLRPSAGSPMQLGDLVKQISGILEQYRTQTLDAMENGLDESVSASLDYLAQPKNSFVVRLKNETYAAIHTAFDRLCTEARYNGIQEKNFTAWEVIEGEDRQLRDQFASLAAFTLSHSRVFSSREGAYVTRDAQKTNNVMLNIALQKTINRLREYITRRRGGPQPREHLRTYMNIDAQTLASLALPG